MGEFIDKVKGAANDAVGKTKLVLGKSTDNPELVVKGKTQQMKGKAQKAAGDIKGAMGDKF